MTARRTANALLLPDPIDAEHALGQLAEALVLSYAHDAAARTFVLITDYPDKAPGAARSFCALRFDGVDRFAREPGNLTELQVFDRRYELTDGTRSIVVQALKTSGSGGTRMLEAWFGPSFGGCRFGFRRSRPLSVTLAPRSATATGSTATRAPANWSNLPDHSPA